MKIKNIVGVIIIILVLLGVMYWGRAAQKPGESNPAKKETVITAEEKFYDFGTISMAKGNVSKKFLIRNNTGKEVILSRLTTSCMCTAAYFLKSETEKRGPFGMPGMGYVPRLNEKITDGESREIEVVYNPAAHGPAGVGPIDRFVYLEDSDGGILTFEIKALVTP